MFSSRVSEIALDNFRFLTIPETFHTSKTIVWFSRIISVDNLCRKSILVSFSKARNLAIFSLAFSYRLEPLVFLDPTFRRSSYIFMYIYIFKETYTQNLHYRTQYQ